MCLLEKMTGGDGETHWPCFAAGFALNQAFSVTTLSGPQGFCFPTDKSLHGQVCATPKQISPYKLMAE